MGATDGLPACARLNFSLRLALLTILFFSGSSLYPRVGFSDDVGIRAPEGFEVSLYASDDLAHDIYSMTIDSHGRVVVAGAGYVKTLHDDNCDGRADRATLFSEHPKSGAHGLLFDGDTLYATGDNGILKLVDRDGDGKADGPPQRWVEGLSHKEHGANGIERGPDGHIYVICGNDAGVTEEFASTPDSPVTKPNCGAILRFSPDGRESEILAHGFRNPYDLCFHPHGNIFTVDADGERDHHLPWYAPNRLFDVAIGMHHGWVLNGWQWSWNRPASYFDNVERCAEIGRGSPTGLLCYRHTQFPQKYRGGIFSACWTLGRIYHYPLTPRGSTFDGKVETFLETTGEVGFAPVDMAVGPEGDMFVAIGGRRTRGSVFRVRYVGPVSDTRREPTNALERVLDAPQPLDAWSRAKWLPEAKICGKASFEKAAIDETLPFVWRARAMEIVTELFEGLSDDTFSQILEHRDVSNADPRTWDASTLETRYLAARAIWSLGRTRTSISDQLDPQRIAKVRSTRIQRALWEGMGHLLPSDAFQLSLFGDRRTFVAYIRAKARAIEREGKLLRDADDDREVVQRLTTDFFRGKVTESTDRMIRDLSAALRMFVDVGNERETQRHALRLMFIALGDLHVEPGHAEKLAGYSLANDEVGPAILSSGGVKRQLAKCFEAFPSNDKAINFEITRLAAALGWDDTQLVDRISNQFDDQASPVEDIHYLMCLSRIAGERTAGMRANIAAGIARLDGKMRQRGWYPSRNWPDRVGETFATLAKYDSDLPQAVAEHEAFKSPSQAFLFTRLAPEHQANAARKLLKSVKDIYDEDEARWSPEMVTLVASLPADEALPALREAWDDFALRDAILLHLAKSPELADRERFFESLTSIQPNIVETAASALQKLNIKPTDDGWLALMQGLRQACSAPPAKSARQALAALAEVWSGEKFKIKEKNDNLLASYQPCFNWFAQEHPVLSRKLNELSGDIASWKVRLAAVNWTTGDVARGKEAFERRSCSKCHGGTSPLGPDLAGAAGRFSRDDLFTAILDPTKDVAPLYQATQIITGSGKIYHGLVVYESPDGTLLTTGPETTIRIAGDEILSVRKSRLSIMPTGLLGNASDAELADLYAYLQTLRGKK